MGSVGGSIAQVALRPGFLLISQPEIFQLVEYLRHHHSSSISLILPAHRPQVSLSAFRSAILRMNRTLVVKPIKSSFEELDPTDPLSQLVGVDNEMVCAESHRDYFNRAPYPVPQADEPDF